MSIVLTHLTALASDEPSRPAMVRDQQQLSYSELWQEVQALTSSMMQLSPRCVAVDIREPMAWLVSDLALGMASYPSIPLPGFFTAEQQQHAMRAAGAGWLISDVLRSDVSLSTAFYVRQTRLWVYELPYSPVDLHQGTAKITFTSGTTAEPKGVCLSQAAMETVAHSLHQALGAEVAAHHASIMPLSILLENIAGFYTTLLAGGCYHAQGDNRLPLAAFLASSQATSCILVPQLLRQLIHQLQQHPLSLPHLRYVAVGGAAVLPDLLEQAAQIGLPVYQGYGLSESASVTCINTPHDNEVGSVGKPLAHVKLEVAEDNELWLHEPLFLGYVGEPAAPGRYATGDSVRMDASGHLYIIGRKKHVLITANGRNISPEWPESVLLAHPEIAQAVVVGDAQPHLAALIVSTASDEAINQAVQVANQTLPDYACIKQWMRIQPLSIENQCLTGTGRVRRAQTHQYYRDSITSLFEREYDEVF